MHSTLMDNRKKIKQRNNFDNRGDLSDIKESFKNFLNYHTRTTGRSVSDLRGIINCFVIINFFYKVNVKKNIYKFATEV